jgi:hypothetical protein
MSARRIRKKTLLHGAAAALTVALAAASALASAVASAVPFDVRIYDRTEHRYLPTYEFGGRLYVVGRPGNEYALSFFNRGGERVLAVASVDGVNVVSGETAAPAQTGYVFSPWQSADINGWRKSLSSVAAFYFTDHSNSYAARTGRPNDVGVIGVALFRERQRPPEVAPYAPPTPYERSDRQERDRASGYAEHGAPAQSGMAESRDRGAGGADALSQAPSPSNAPGDAYRRPEKSLGTGHGRQESSQTRYTDFVRASSTPDQVITIYYDTYANLAALGVPVWRENPYDRDDAYGWRRSPRPFPRDANAGFVPDPR